MWSGSSIFETGTSGAPGHAFKQVFTGIEGPLKHANMHMMDFGHLRQAAVAVTVTVQVAASNAVTGTEALGVGFWRLIANHAYKIL